MNPRFILKGTALTSLALRWTVRPVIGTCVSELRSHLTNRWRHAGLTAANLVFTCLPVVCGGVALRGVMP